MRCKSLSCSSSWRRPSANSLSCLVSTPFFSSICLHTSANVTSIFCTEVTIPLPAPNAHPTTAVIDPMTICSTLPEPPCEPPPLLLAMAPCYPPPQTARLLRTVTTLRRPPHAVQY